MDFYPFLTIGLLHFDFVLCHVRKNYVISSPVCFEEDEAMEEAIRRSLQEEPVESLLSSRCVVLH